MVSLSSPRSPLGFETHRNVFLPTLMLSLPTTPKCRRQSGFTLVEAMMSMVIFSLCSLGFFQALVKGYQLTALARTHDNARAALRGYVDQFQRLSIRKPTAGNPDPGEPLALFTVTGSPTGNGLRGWGQICDALYNEAQPSTVYLQIGPEGSSINALITREVSFINPTTGVVSGTDGLLAAGYLLQATFTITYTAQGRTYTKSITTMRADA
jgi:prepilin-type N-terminal cleavage/methylation domain-containing protein